MANQRQAIAKIYQNQDKLNKQLNEFRQSLVTQMYRSLCDNESYIKRVKKLIQIRLNKGMPVSERAATLAIQFYNKISKRKQAHIPVWGLVAGGSIMYAYLINKYNVNDNIRAVLYQEQVSRISEQKEAFIMSDIQYNRGIGKCFYLCSSHSDSAEDHKDYQGKLYIDRYCTDPEALEYAKKHNIKEYQWVIDAPVYMVTRPNCRHYFKPLSTAEVIGNSRRELIKKYDMHRKIGDRPVMQTLSTVDKNVEVIIKSYEDRLKIHIDMYRARPNDFLKSAIHKDNLLLKKWRAKLK